MGVRHACDFLVVGGLKNDGFFSELLIGVRSAPGVASPTVLRTRSLTIFRAVRRPMLETLKGALSSSSASGSPSGDRKDEATAVSVDLTFWAAGLIQQCCGAAGFSEPVLLGVFSFREGFWYVTAL